MQSALLRSGVIPIQGICPSRPQLFNMQNQTSAQDALPAEEQHEMRHIVKELHTKQTWPGMVRLTVFAQKCDALSLLRMQYLQAELLLVPPRPAMRSEHVVACRPSIGLQTRSL